MSDLADGTTYKNKKHPGETGLERGGRLKSRILFWAKLSVTCILATQMEMSSRQFKGGGLTYESKGQGWEQVQEYKFGGGGYNSRAPSSFNYL